MSGFHLSLPSLPPPLPLDLTCPSFPPGFLVQYHHLLKTLLFFRQWTTQRLKFSFNLLILHLGEFSETGRIFEMVTGWMKDKDVWKNG